MTTVRPDTPTPPCGAKLGSLARSRAMLALLVLALAPWATACGSGAVTGAVVGAAVGAAIGSDFDDDVCPNELPFARQRCAGLEGRTPEPPALQFALHQALPPNDNGKRTPAQALCSVSIDPPARRHKGPTA